MTEETEVAIKEVKETPIFQYKVVKDKDKKALYQLYTPMNHLAYDWAIAKIYDAPLWGRSYVVSDERGRKLWAYLVHKCGFVVQPEPRKAHANHKKPSAPHK